MPRTSSMASAIAARVITFSGAYEDGLKRRRRIRWRIFLRETVIFSTLAGALALSQPAEAGNDKFKAAAPRPAASAPHLGGGGAPHLPGGMGAGGGAHIPGSMGGAHIPGSMGGAHMPGGMAGGGAHMPSSMGSGAHVPSALGNAAHVPRPVAAGNSHVGVASTTHVARSPGAGVHGAPVHAAVAGAAAGAAAAHLAGAHVAGGGLHGGGLHGGGLHGGGLAGEHGAGAHTTLASHDPRMGGAAALHTKGLEAGLAQHHEARPFLHADPHRNIAADHAFVAQHAADFHTRNVRDFSPRELGAWRAGAWRNEWHYGRRGWWWEVDGVWYPYLDPIWPFPLVVAPLVVFDTPYIDGPDFTAEEDVPVAMASIEPLPPAPVGLYHCADPNGNFPLVGACNVSWDLVTAPAPVAIP